MHFKSAIKSFITILIFTALLGKANASETASWTQIPLLSARIGASMAFDSKAGTFVLFGGTDGDSHLNDTWIFDPNSHTWTNVITSNPPAPRAFASMVYDTLSDTFILFGGEDGNNGLNDTWIFDLKTLSWTLLNTSSAPPPRANASMAINLANGLCLLFGGDDGNTYLNDTWIFNTSNKNWTQLNLSASPIARTGACLSFDSSQGKFILFGGRGNSNLLNDTWLFDPNNFTWTELTPLNSPSARSFASMVFDSTSSSSVLFGGGSNTGIVNDTWTFQLATTTWTRLNPPTSPFPRYATMMSFDSQNGNILLFGGTSDLRLFNDTWIFNLADWTDLGLQTSPSPRQGASMAFDTAQDTFLLFGGTDGNYLNDTWAFNEENQNWTQLNPLTAPPARAFASFIYDSVNGFFVLFGGEDDSGFLNDTWIFNPQTSSWSELNLSSFPPARSNACMAYDFTHNIIVLFGGRNNNGFLDDTWTFNPVNLSWVELHPSISPPERASASMAFGLFNSTFVLFGGENSLGLLNDTWVFDLTSLNWTQLHPSLSPSARLGAAFDSSMNVFALFGGVSDDGLLNDTWLFDLTNSNWTQLNASPSPNSRSYAIMDFDLLNQTSVLFGGQGCGGYLGDTALLTIINDPASTIILNATPNPALLGKTVTFTATVTNSPNFGMPTGAIIFIVDGILEGPIPLVNGQASIQTSGLEHGNHTIAALYSGDAHYSSSSAVLTEEIVLLFPPLNLKVSQIKDSFATQIERINVLKWEAPTTGEIPVLYKIYTDPQLTQLIGQVTADKSINGKFKFQHHNRKKKQSYSYYIVSVDAYGNSSMAAEIVFRYQ